MAIPNGTRLGSYEILHPIGAGGMGVVYRACDVRLGRPVAIKMLPASCASDEGRLRLFEQEARALSSINHPNIVTLYALGDPDDSYYIVMELVEGRTLRQELSGERMKLRAVLDIGTQVASALNAAHSAGIVHRDIKPENVMVRPDGLVKILDFGLAKLTQPFETLQSLPSNPNIFNQDTLSIDAHRPPASNPYVTTPHDSAGKKIRRILGTATYMSPENLQGEDVDARTDIFSLGVTLYELIAGVAPFGGSTPAEVIDSILERDPPPLSRYRPGVPRDLEHIVSKAMRKDRDCRYQHTKDLLIDLQDVKQEREFEDTLKRSTQSELFCRPETTALSAQSGPEIIRAESNENGKSSIPPATSASRIILAEIMDSKIEDGINSLLPADVNLVILVTLKRPFGVPTIDDP